MSSVSLSVQFSVCTGSARPNVASSFSFDRAQPNEREREREKIKKRANIERTFHRMWHRIYQLLDNVASRTRFPSQCRFIFERRSFHPFVHCAFGHSSAVTNNGRRPFHSQIGLAVGNGISRFSGDAKPNRMRYRTISAMSRRLRMAGDDPRRLFVLEICGFGFTFP